MRFARDRRGLAGDPVVGRQALVQDAGEFVELPGWRVENGLVGLAAA